MEITLSSSSSRMSAIDMEVLDAIAEVKAAYAARARKQGSSSLLSSRVHESTSMDREAAASRRDVSTDTAFLLSVSSHASGTENFLPIKDAEEGTHDADIWSARAWTVPPDIPVHSQHQQPRCPPTDSVENQVEHMSMQWKSEAPSASEARSYTEAGKATTRKYQFAHQSEQTSSKWGGSNASKQDMQQAWRQWKSEGSGSTSEARSYIEAAKAKARTYQFTHQSEQTSRKWGASNASKQDMQRDWRSTLRASTPSHRPRSAGQPWTPQMRGKSTAGENRNTSRRRGDYTRSDYTHALELQKLKSYPGTFGAAETGRLLQQSFSGWLGAIVNTDGGPASYEAEKSCWSTSKKSMLSRSTSFARLNPFADVSLRASMRMSHSVLSAMF